MFNRLKQLFSDTPSDADEMQEEFEEESQSFVWTEHMRIVLAIVVVILGAMAMWWIVA